VEELRNVLGYRLALPDFTLTKRSLQIAKEFPVEVRDKEIERHRHLHLHDPV